MLKEEGIPKISTHVGHSQGAWLLGMPCSEGIPSTKHWG